MVSLGVKAELGVHICALTSTRLRDPDEEHSQVEQSLGCDMVTLKLKAGLGMSICAHTSTRLRDTDEDHGQVVTWLDQGAKKNPKHCGQVEGKGEIGDAHLCTHHRAQHETARG